MSRQREQKLAAIYDAFDAKNYKGVIKLANAAIQRYPDQQVFKSLKAVALEKTGKMEEALQLVEQVLAAAPPDDHVLTMLLLVLKPANRVSELLHAYEAACSKDPGNEELMQGLFACHVRSFNFRELQQVAMKLKKQHPSEQYQWWVVCSLALQAHSAAAQAQLAAAQGHSTANGAQQATAPAAGLGADKLLQLAEAMAARLLSKQQAGAAGATGPSWEAVMLYLGLLQAQGKFNAALAALRGPLGDAISLPAERREAEAALLLAKGDLAAAVQLYQAAVQEQPDDWALLLLYLDCLLPSTAETLPAISSAAVAQMLMGVEASTLPGFQMGGLAALLSSMNTDDESSRPTIQERVAQAEAFISSLPTTAPGEAAANGVQESGSNNNSNSSKPAPLLRGPALAQVELAKRRLLLGLGEEQMLADALLQYHDRLGHVVSCAMDVHCYLPLLTADHRTALSQQLQQRAQQAAAELQELQQQQQQPLGTAGQKQQLHLLRRQMAAMQIHADLGGPCFTTAAAAQQHAQELMCMYAAALPCCEGLDVRERGPADELLWLAAAALMKAAALEQQQQQQQPPGGCEPGSSSSSMGFMVQALLVLEAAVKGRPYCAPARLGLTGLYGLLGNTRAAGQHFGALEVKHIQHDTLASHHMLPLLLGLGAHEDAEGLLRLSLALFEDHLRDAGDTLMQAYKTGTHTKVLEFICFKERLERSHSYVLARAEWQLLNISQAAVTALEPAVAAAHAAVADLPLQLLDSCDWRGMRFNDDLTTRLPWLPPIQGPRHLMVLLWWEDQQQQHGDSGSSGGQTSWWQRVAAAEADLPEAARFRAAMGAAAQQRWLLPHLLAAAVHTGSARSSGSGGCGTAIQQQQVASLPDLLVPYAASLGCSSVAALEQEVSMCFGQKQLLPASRKLQLLNAALFALAAPVQDLLAAAHGESSAAAAAADLAAACSSISQRGGRLGAGLQQLQQQACTGLRSSCAYLGCLLPGDVLSLAALLLSESCAWLLVCLEAWSKSLKHARSRKKSKKQPEGAAADTNPDAPASLQEERTSEAAHALAAVQAALVSCLETIAGSAGQLLAVPAADLEASLLAEFDPSSNVGLQTLVGWEQRASVQPVLMDLIKGQRQVLQQIKSRSGALIKRATHVSW